MSLVHFDLLHKLMSTPCGVHLRAQYYVFVIYLRLIYCYLLRWDVRHRDVLGTCDRPLVAFTRSDA